MTDSRREFAYVEEGIWSVRIPRSHRVLGVLEGDTLIWFWIGNHDPDEHHLLKTLKNPLLEQVSNIWAMRDS